LPGSADAPAAIRFAPTQSRPQHARMRHERRGGRSPDTGGEHVWRRKRPGARANPYLISSPPFPRRPARARAGVPWGGENAWENKRAGSRRTRLGPTTSA
jgi:hypothetical protein